VWSRNGRLSYEGMGPEVLAMERVMASDFSTKSIAIGTWADPYPAASVDVLAPTAAEKALILLGSFVPAAVLYSHGVNRFLGSIKEGVTAGTVEVLNENASCPETKIVLAGYSQGAIVMHKVELQLSKDHDGAALRSIGATLLLADGDRTPNSSAREFGTSAANGQGVQTLVDKLVSADVNRGHDVMRPKTTANICNAGDLVCNFSLGELFHFSKASQVHTSYVKASGAILKPVAAVVHAVHWATQFFASPNKNPGSGLGAFASASVDSTQIDKIDCPSLSFCLADDKNGSVLTNGSPVASPASWSFNQIAFDQLNAAIACPSLNECFIGDANGAVWTSADPTDGSTAIWSDTFDDPSGGVSGISCPNIDFCVATDLSGNLMWSTSPTTGNWSETQIDYVGKIYDVSCPSTSLCVAVDESGNILTSTHPMGGAGAWSLVDVDGSNNLYSVSCPTTHFCAAVDGNGNVLTSANPQNPTDWRSGFVDPLANVGGGTQISCPTTGFCVFGDDQGDVVSSTNPLGGDSTWVTTNLGSSAIFGVSCPGVQMCIAVDNAGYVYWEST